MNTLGITKNASDLGLRNVNKSFPVYFRQSEERERKVGGKEMSGYGMSTGIVGSCGLNCMRNVNRFYPVYERQSERRKKNGGMKMSGYGMNHGILGSSGLNSLRNVNRFYPVYER